MKYILRAYEDGLVLTTSGLWIDNIPKYSRAKIFHTIEEVERELEYQKNKYDIPHICICELTDELYQDWIVQILSN